MGRSFGLGGTCIGVLEIHKRIRQNDRIWLAASISGRKQGSDAYEVTEEHPAQALDRVHGWWARVTAVEGLGLP